MSPREHDRECRELQVNPAADTKHLLAPDRGRNGQKLHPVVVRLMHWVNAVAILVMITSGWGIYNDDVIIRGLHFAHGLRLGDWAAWSLNWHFAGMWFLVLNGAAYLIHGVVTRRLWERYLPIRPADFIATVKDTLHFKIKHEDVTTYNAVQKVLYIVAILAGISQVVTGLAIWKPVPVLAAGRPAGRVRNRRASSTSPAWRSSSASCSCTWHWRCSCRKPCGPC